MGDRHYKHPRLFVPQDLNLNTRVSFSVPQAHYLKNVLRLKAMDYLRVFNGYGGEWLVTLTELNKKVAYGACVELIRAQPRPSRSVHLFFAPLKKARLDFLIEKSVELGATHLHPVITAHTEVRKLNDERLLMQISEAAEQCERLDIPELVDIIPLFDLSFEGTLYAALERESGLEDLKNIAIEQDQAMPVGVLVGPEGGFSPQEMTFLKEQDFIVPVSLGSNILRAETAALKALSCLC